MDTDPQEGHDVVGRLGGTGHDEDRSKVMYSLPGPSGQDEYDAYQPHSEDQVNTGELFVWFIRAATAGYIVVFAVRMLSDDEIRLHLMHASIRLFQSIARTFGAWALETEKAYNQYVDTLH